MLLRKLQLSLCVGGLLSLFACKTTENSASAGLKQDAIAADNFEVSCGTAHRCMLYVTPNSRTVSDPKTLKANTTCQIDGPYLATPNKKGYVITKCSENTTFYFSSPRLGYANVDYDMIFDFGDAFVNTDRSGFVPFAIKGPATSICIKYSGNFKDIIQIGENQSSTLTFANDETRRQIKVTEASNRKSSFRINFNPDSSPQVAFSASMTNIADCN